MKHARQPYTIGQALSQAADRLTQLPDAEPRLDAEVLLAHLLDVSRTHLFAWPEKALTPEQQTRFDTLISKRLSGKPLAYITGWREFWSMEFEVTPATLIPRPETEILVERALELIPENTPARVADLGTGSGAIAAAVASERPLTRVFASDFSEKSLTVARRNFQRLQLGNIDSNLGSWCQALPRDVDFDLILSNPPYVAEGDPHLDKNGLPWEPDCALTSGTDGLDDIRKIITQAHNHLKPGGQLLLEHGLDQGVPVRELMASAGYQKVSTLQDLAGRDRVTEGITPS